MMFGPLGGLHTGGDVKGDYSFNLLVHGNNLRVGQ